MNTPIHESWPYGHNEHIELLISTPLLKAIDDYADLHTITRSEAIRRAISQLTGIPDPGRRTTYASDRERLDAYNARRRALRRKH